MFMSLKYGFSVQTICSATGQHKRWIAIEDKPMLIEYLKRCAKYEDVYRVASVDYFGEIIMVTHKYCERMIWGDEAFGIGLKN